MPRTGRPKKEITVTPEQFIETLSECGCTKTEIACRLNISVDTFDRSYAALYRKGKECGKSKLREKLVQTALAGNVTALIFLAKATLGLKETNALELSGPDGQPIEMNASDARTRLAALLARSSARQPAEGVPGEPV
jgi:hypothetical protein